MRLIILSTLFSLLLIACGDSSSSTGGSGGSAGTPGTGGTNATGGNGGDGVTAGGVRAAGAGRHERHRR